MGIKVEFSVLLTVLYWNTTGALNDSFNTFPQRHPAVISVRKTAAQPHSASCNVLLSAMKNKGNGYVFPFPPQSFSPPNFVNSISLKKMHSFSLEDLSGRIVLLLYIFLCMCAHVCVKKALLEAIFCSY